LVFIGVQRRLSDFGWFFFEWVRTVAVFCGGSGFGLGIEFVVEGDDLAVEGAGLAAEVAFGADEG
jgi:hypothetical protein